MELVPWTAPDDIKDWQYGTAKVISVRRDRVRVSCPFCPEVHVHQRFCLGSREVLAGCHTGFTRCRSYVIPVRSR
jgi:hypothetical protein